MASYAPTQIIAEMFRLAGFDGIGYRSSLQKDGYNIALFDLKAADVRAAMPWQVDRIRVDASQMGNAYVRAKYDKK